MGQIDEVPGDQQPSTAPVYEWMAWMDGWLGWFRTRLLSQDGRQIGKEASGPVHVVVARLRGPTLVTHPLTVAPPFLVITHGWGM